MSSCAQRKAEVGMLKVVAGLASCLFLSLIFISVAHAHMAELPISEVLALAKSGNAEAQDELGFRYASGLDVDEDYGQAAKWYQAAAEQGHAAAQNELGGFYDKGVGVRKDTARAAYWYEKAASQGYAPAQFNLSVKLSAGEGVAKDQVLASKWLRKAADGGWCQAEYNLGVKYVGGVGVKNDPGEAAKWFRRSADHGFPMAMFNLANSYLTGTGIKQDPIEAYKWLYLAAGKGARQKEITQKASKQLRKMTHSEMTVWLYALDGEELRRAERGLSVLEEAMTKAHISSAIRQANAWSPKD